jgi:two-component system chemotaxis response regulator CheY
MKTLIADDDIDCGLLLRAVFERYGPTCVTTNGQEAVDAAREALDAGQPYNLITMDITMPDMDGRTALKEIRRLETDRGIAPIHGARVIMMTGHNDSENILGSFRSECDAFAIKPMDPVKLLGYVRAFGLIE